MLWSLTLHTVYRHVTVVNQQAVDYNQINTSLATHMWRALDGLSQSYEPCHIRYQRASEIDNFLGHAEFSKNLNLLCLRQLHGALHLCFAESN